MWRLRISSKGLPDRFERLGAGTRLLGSGFDCDPCLVQPGIAKKHAKLTIDADGVAIEPFEAVRAVDQGMLLPLGKSTRLKIYTDYAVGEVVFQIGRDETATRPLKTPGTRKRATKYLEASFTQASLAFASTAMVFASLQSDPSGRTAMAASMIPIAAIPGPQQPVEQAEPETMMSLADWAKAQGIEQVDVAPAASGSRITVFARTELEKAEIEDQLRAAPVRGNWQVVADGSLLGAVNMVLAGLGAQASRAELLHGNLQLVVDGVSSQRRTQIMTALERDVPMLRRITLADSMASESKPRDGEVAGVWMGPTRFVVSKSGTYVREGAEISAGRVVSAILDDGSVIIKSKSP